MMEIENVRMRTKYGFVEIFSDRINELIGGSELRMESWGFIGALSPCLHSPSNSILLNGTTPTQDQMANYIHVGRTTMHHILKELEMNNVIRRKKIAGDTYIYFNPFLYSAGDISSQTYDYFLGENAEITDNSFSEHILENYLVDDLSLIEDGMKLIKRQHRVEGGYIDILATDKNGTKCIIELKVVDNDTSVVFQSVFYPTQFKEKVRMITIAPNYSKRITCALNSLNYVEMLRYEFDKDNNLSVFKN